MAEFSGVLKSEQCHVAVTENFGCGKWSDERIKTYQQGKEICLRSVYWFYGFFNLMEFFNVMGF